MNGDVEVDLYENASRAWELSLELEFMYFSTQICFFSQPFGRARFT